jgi:putative sigma-54 modulation protein
VEKNLQVNKLTSFFMTINIHGTGIELTDAIKEYAEEKMSQLTKFFDNIQQINIDVGKQSHHHNKGEVFYAEVNVHIPGHMLRIVKEEQDLYKAIDKVKDHFKVELEKIKEKMRRKDKSELRAVKGMQEE